jgi:hypothetical protein
MKSHIIQVGTNKVGLIFLLLALAVGMAHAQSGIWKVDAEHSTARLSLGSVETGVARVSGNVAFDVNNPVDPVVNLSIGSGVPTADDPQISFHSERSAMTSDGKLAVTGKLSVTRVERPVIAYSGGGEGYYGAQYGDPVVQTDSRKITLVFPQPGDPQNGRMQLTASTDVSRERFPQLVDALAEGNWPSVVVEDQQCMIATPVGEDYHGADCTGTPVEAASNSVTTYTGGGEGYYGSERIAVPDGSHATIALDLQLTQVASAPSAAQTAGN